MSKLTPKSATMGMLVAVVLAALIGVTSVDAPIAQAASGLLHIDRIEISSEPENGDTYRVGEVIDIKITAETSTVPLLKSSFISVPIGEHPRKFYIDEDRWASYLIFDKCFLHDEYVFSYTVQPEDLDADGIDIDFIDSTAAIWPWIAGLNAADLACNRDRTLHHGFDLEDRVDSKDDHSPEDHKVDGRPMVEDVDVVSVPQDGGDFAIGESIDLDVEFNHPVDVVNENFFVSLWFDGDGTDQSVWKGAYYQGGSGTDTLKFSYTVQLGDRDANGLNVGSHTSTQFGEGNIKAAGTQVNALHHYTGFTSDYGVEGRPQVADVKIVSEPSDGTAFAIEETIDLEVEFNHPVDVVNENFFVSLWFDGDGTDASVWKGAYYQGGSGTDALQFSYTVKPGDYDEDGLNVGSHTSTQFGEGNIKAAGTQINALHHYTGFTSLYGVDGSSEENANIGGL